MQISLKRTDHDHPGHTHQSFFCAAHQKIIQIFEVGMTSKGQDLDNGVKEHSLQSVSVDTVDVQKSQTTTWDAKNPGNNEINFLSTGEGFLNHQQ